MRKERSERDGESNLRGLKRGRSKDSRKLQEG